MGEYLENFIMADNFFLFFEEEKAEAKAEEIRKQNKIAKIYRNRDKFTVFEIKKRV